MVRAPCCEKMGLKKGPWTPEEDQVLVSYIHKYGHGNWRALPKQAGLLRCGKSCRLRWTNYLRPDIKRGNFTKEEEDSIIQLHQLLGNRWSAIAGRLPGRTDNEIKNVWHTHLKKRLKPTESITNKGNCVNDDDDLIISNENDDQKKKKKVEKQDDDQIVEIEDDDHINPSSPDQQSSTSCNSSWSASRSISSSSMSSNDNSTATTNSSDQFDPAEVSLPDEFWLETLSLDNSTTSAAAADGSNCLADRFLMDEMSSFDEYRMDNYDHVIPFVSDEIILDPLFELDQILPPSFSPLSSPSPSPVMRGEDLQGHDDHDGSMDFWMNVLMEAGNSQQMNIAGF